MPSAEMTRQQSLRLKGRFLEHFAEYGNVTAAAKAVGIERNTVYVWQERDDQFVAAFREAEIKATEVLEAEARRRAVEGSDTLLIFLLKARAPERYRERYDVTTGGQPIVKAYAAEDLALLDVQP